jgi:hypothetical protein
VNSNMDGAHVTVPMTEEELSYLIETITWRGEFIREEIFQAAMRAVAGCGDCSTMALCPIADHAAAKEEIAAWAMREAKKLDPFPWSGSMTFAPMREYRFGLSSPVALRLLLAGITV